MTETQEDRQLERVGRATPSPSHRCAGVPQVRGDSLLVVLSVAAPPLPAAAPLSASTPPPVAAAAPLPLPTGAPLPVAAAAALPVLRAAAFLPGGHTAANQSAPAAAAVPRAGSAPLTHLFRRSSWMSGLCSLASSCGRRRTA